MSETYIHLNEEIKAAHYAEDALSLCRNSGDRQLIGEVYLSLGKIYLNLERCKEAEEYYEKGLDTCAILKNNLLRSKILLKLGELHIQQSNLSKSHTYLSEALDIFQSNHDKGNIALTKLLVGKVLVKLKEYSKASAILSECKNLFYELEDFDHQLESRLLIGSILMEGGCLKEALEEMNTCLEQFDDISDENLKIITLIYISRIYLALSQHVQAIEQAKKALRESHKTCNLEYEVQSRIVLGKAYLLTNDDTGSMKHLQKALQLAERANNKYYHMICQFEIALIYEKTCQISDAILSLKDSINACEEIRRQQDIEFHKSSFLSGHFQLYEKMITLLLNSGKYDLALQFSERCRARTFLDMLENGPSIPNQYDLITLKSNVEPCNPEELQKFVGEDTTIIEYFITEKDLFIWVIEGFVMNVEKVEIDSVNLSTQVRSILKSLSITEDIDPSLNGLYNSIFYPIEKHLNQDNLIIIAHKYLHSLPFQILIDNNEKYLLERFNIRYLPSASVMKHLKRNRSITPESTILAIGNPHLESRKFPTLKKANKEVQSIKQIFKNTDLLTNKMATKTNVLSKFSDYDIVHFACHAYVDKSAPLQSCLLLSSDNAEDGALSLSEIFEHDFSPNLLVLSACETGIGSLDKSDDMMCISRVFMSTGIPSVIASLWRVDDESTAFLMKEFYKYLKENKTSEALRLAQLATKKKYNHIFHWAPFVYTGLD